MRDHVLQVRHLDAPGLIALVVRLDIPDRPDAAVLVKDEVPWAITPPDADISLHEASEGVGVLSLSLADVFIAVADDITDAEICALFRPNDILHGIIEAAFVFTDQGGIELVVWQDQVVSRRESVRLFCRVISGREICREVGEVDYVNGQG